MDDRHFSNIKNNMKKKRRKIYSARVPRAEKAGGNEGREMRVWGEGNEWGTTWELGWELREHEDTTRKRRKVGGVQYSSSSS